MFSRRDERQGRRGATKMSMEMNSGGEICGQAGRQEPSLWHFMPLLLAVSLVCLAPGPQAGPARPGKSNSPGGVEDSTSSATAAPGLSYTERESAEKLAKAGKAVAAGRYLEGLNLAAAVAKLNPDNGAAWQYMGIAYRGMKQYRNSLAAWKKAYEIEKDPAMKEAILWYFKATKRPKRRSPARRPEAVSPAQNPALSAEQTEDLLNSAVNYYVSREFGKAREMFMKVLAADPHNPDAQIALGRINGENGF